MTPRQTRTQALIERHRKLNSVAYRRFLAARMHKVTREMKRQYVELFVLAPRSSHEIRMDASE